MARFKCPNCKQETLSTIDKYRLGLWMTVTCDQCGARITALPLLLMLLWFFHAWNIIWWSALVYLNHSLHYLIFMVICWASLEAININLMPLATLRAKDSPSKG